MRENENGFVKLYNNTVKIIEDGLLIIKLTTNYRSKWQS